MGTLGLSGQNHIRCWRLSERGWPLERECLIESYTASEVLVTKTLANDEIINALAPSPLLCDFFMPC